MNKRGAAEELQLFLIIEFILGMAVAVILVMAANPDLSSNVNQIYIQDDFELLYETLESSPGTVEYHYEIKDIFEIEPGEDEITVSKTDSLFSSDTITYTCTKEQNKPGVKCIYE